MVLIRPAALVLSLMLVRGGGAGATVSSDFDKFSVTFDPPRHAVPVRVRTSQDARYATQLRVAARGKADFAGHYVLATWGCGASCVMGAAIDARTGAVAWLPFTVCCFPASVTEPLEHRRDSRLLRVRGMRDETGAATDVADYVFDGAAFVLSPGTP